MVESFENRDLQCANEVAEMARLGKFDTEFLIFGSAVQERNGKIYYYATTKQRKLYEYIEQAWFEERYFMPMVRYMQRLQVPSDLKDEWMTRVKVALIQNMKQQYALYLPMMRPFFLTLPNNAAEALLINYKCAIDGYFDDTLLQLFWGLVKMSYEKKILTRRSYQQFKLWHDKVRRQMDDDPMITDNITRVFYGFVYVDERGKRQSVIDAQVEEVAQKHQRMLMKGYLVAPIIKKQYALKQFNEMPKVRKSYREWLLSVESEEYMSLVQKLNDMPGVIDGCALQAVLDVIGMHEYATYATLYYQALWNLC